MELETANWLFWPTFLFFILLVTKNYLGEFFFFFFFFFFFYFFFFFFFFFFFVFLSFQYNINKAEGSEN